MTKPRYPMIRSLLKWADDTVAKARAEVRENVSIQRELKGLRRYGATSGKDWIDGIPARAAKVTALLEKLARVRITALVISYLTDATLERMKVLL